MFTSLFSLTVMSEQMVTNMSECMGIWYPILYNSIGIISIFTQFAVFQMKKRENIILVNLASNLGWLLYFVLQGDLLTGISNVIGILSNIIYFMRTKYRWADSKLWLIFFLLFAGTFSVLTFETPNDIFPLLACLSSMTAFFMIKEENIRKISLFTFLMFMCNSIINLYFVALFADITAFISVIIALYRYRKKE